MRNTLKNSAIALSAFLFIFLPASLYSQTASSEQRINIQEIDAPLDKVLRLEPIGYEHSTFLLEKLNMAKGTQYGFEVESVKQVMPELVSSSYRSYSVGKNNKKQVSLESIDTEKLIPLLVGAIQEQQAEIELLKQQVAHFTKEKQ